MAAPTANDRAVRDTPQVSMPGFVGRDREVALLTQALVEPAVVLVEGEAGIGKSRLVQEFLAATPGSHRIAVGMCPPFRESPTLGPIVEAVRRSRDTLAGLHLSALAGALRPLFPEWAAHLPQPPEPLPDPPAVRHRLFRALAELIGELGITVLVVEDVHWADVATLEFILFLVCRQPQPVSLIVTYRPEDVPPDSLLLRLSSRLPATTSQLRLRLQPLDVAGTARMVASMLGGQEVSQEFARFLHQRTDGVPLALEESVRLLRDRADLVRKDGSWARRGGAELQVPPTVRDAVLERVQRLSGEAHLVLQACAVLGEPLDESIVVQVANLSDDQARLGLTEAMGCGLLREDREARLSFRHVLPRRAVYEATPAVERRRLHRRAGEALEQLEPTPALQLTRHFREAHESERWARYAEQAAGRAVASGDHGAAAALLSDLLAGAELSLPARVRLARKLASATLCRRDAVDDLHKRVVEMLRGLLERERLSPREDAELRSGMGRLLSQLGDLEGARAELERAVPNLDHDPAQAARAMAFLGIPYIGTRPGSVHLTWLRRAAEIDPATLSATDRLALTVDRASGLLALGEEDGWAVAAQIPTEAVRMDERLQVTRGHLNVGSLAISWGHYPQARQRLVAALKLADADRYLRVRSRILVALARLDWYSGAWRGLAERLTTLVDAEGPVAYLSTLRLGLLNLAQGSVRRGEDQVRLALDLARRVGAVDDFLEPAAALGRMRLAEGKVDEALSVTDDPMRTIATKAVWVWATDLAPVRVAALVAAERVDEAAELSASYRRGLGNRNAPAPRAGLLTCLATVAEARGEQAAAARMFAAAAQAWEQLPRPYDGLLARERQARCLLAAGETSSAVDILTRLSRGLSDLGARADFDRVAALLAELGVDAQRSWRRGRRGYGDQLSPRELEVVRLLVTGRTNREIADALSRSPKTVAGQLSSAMRKLNVSSRTGLAVAAVDAGLVPDGRPDFRLGIG
jgi:DNA-binding CsgD family transcriptional regulator/tetratricopeptide (TPR) repeat protein